MGTDLISLHQNKASVILQHNPQPGWSQSSLHTAGTTVSVQFFTLSSPARSHLPSPIVSANNQLTAPTMENLWKVKGTNWNDETAVPIPDL